MRLADDFAPEHLVLLVEGARRWVPRLSRAGAVFVGPATPEALGDYLAGLEGQGLEINPALGQLGGDLSAALGIGPFLGALVDFVIISLCVFLITKALLKPAPAPSV